MIDIFWIFKGCWLLISKSLATATAKRRLAPGGNDNLENLLLVVGTIEPISLKLFEQFWNFNQGDWLFTII